MYDSWYVTGLAVMRPGLLKAISDAKPAFNFVDRIIVEVQNGKRTLRPKAPWTGVLEETSTQNVRDAISAFAKKFSASAPPIGIYVAGRFEQYLAIPMFSSALPNKSKFSDIIDLANSAYISWPWLADLKVRCQLSRHF
jgi:hypothetical protein